MKLPVIITGCLSIAFNETRRLMRSSLTPYIWFTLLASFSIYCIFALKYGDRTISQSVMTIRYGETPMGDLIIFFLFYLTSSITEVISGSIPGIVFPVSIGIAFFIIFPLMLCLTMQSEFITKIAAASIAREKEARTLYFLAVTPQTKASIYLGKLMGIFILTLPMIIFLYIVTLIVFTNLFSSAFNLSSLVLKAAFVTALLFSSIGMLISVFSSNAKRASRIGMRVVAGMTILTIFWIFMPLIEFILGSLNSSTGLIYVLEKITYVSPFTLDLTSAYNPAVAAGYFMVQIIATLIFLAIGMVTFIRQDIEY